MNDKNPMTSRECRNLTNGVFTSYWAYSETCGSDVFENRVKLFHDFAIRRKWRCAALADLPRVGKCNLDHFEAYLAGTGVVFICSNYGAKPPPWMLMVECFPLYGHGATSYIRSFEHPQHARAFCKAAVALKWAWRADTYQKMAELCVL